MIRNIVLAFALLLASPALTQTLPQVANNAALQALPARQFPSVYRLGYATAGDGGAALYHSSTTACSLNAGNGDNGAQVRAQDGGCWIVDLRERAPATPLLWGARRDAATNDTQPVQACISSGMPCFVGGGIYMVDGLVVPSGGVLTGEGTLRRIVNSTVSSGVLSCQNCDRVVLSGLRIDGNKANEIVTSIAVTMNGYRDLTMTGVAIENSLGEGIHLTNSRDTAASNTSTHLTRVTTSENTGNGTVVLPPAWDLTFTEHTAVRNGGAGLAVVGATCCTLTPPAAFQFVSVHGGNFSWNGAHGVGFTGYVAGWVGNNQVWGPPPGGEPIFNSTISDVTARGNASYGIVMQCSYCLLSNSISTNNAQNGGPWGGVLGNCAQCEILNVISTGHSNGAYGIDAGCGNGVHIIGGSYSNNTVGVNIGCSSYSSVRDASVQSNSAYQIHAIAAEGGGGGEGLPGYTQTLLIQNDRIACTATPGNRGVDIVDGGYQVDILNNFFQGCDPMNAVRSTAFSGRIQGNLLESRVGTDAASVDYNVNNGSGLLIVPDAAETIGVNGTNNFTGIRRRSVADVGSGISSIQIQTPGTGYSSASTFTVAGCAVQPTGTVWARADGQLTGVRIATRGSGCATPAAVTFSGGSGAAAIALGAPLNRMTHRLELIASTSLTFTSPDNVILNSGIGWINNFRGIMQFRDTYNNFYELTRSAW